MQIRKILVGRIDEYKLLRPKEEAKPEDPGRPQGGKVRIRKARIKVGKFITDKDGILYYNNLILFV